VTLSSFPPNTVMFDPAHSSRRTKTATTADRSTEWSAVLSNVDLLLLDILDDIIAQLTGMRPAFPPRSAPKVSPTLLKPSNLLKPTEVMVSNIFENFRHLDEDSSEDGIIIDNLTPPMTQAPEAHDSVQSRYFPMKFFLCQVRRSESKL
jgi:hypothetical protein